MFTDEEPHGVFFMIDNKSFYASCEAVQRGYNPMKVPLVVLSEANNTNGGLILATSPEAKRLFNIKANVSRKRDLPNDPRLQVVPPRMNLYIKRNLQINRIFTRFAAEQDVWPYSIDESILDMTHSWRLFGNSPREVARLIQKTVRKELGLYTTVGIGDNPVQAKITLDVYSKHNHDLISEMHYETVPDKIWSIQDLTDVWGIGKHMAQRLNQLKIYNMYDLSHANPYFLKEKLGMIGMQLFATAWGVDRSKLSERIKPKSISIGNSQVLPHDYHQRNGIETVIKEIGEQVAARIRHHQKLTGCLSLQVGFSYAAAEMDGRSGLHGTLNISPSDDDHKITKGLLHIFNREWSGQAVRNISVYCSKLVDNTGQQLDLFTDSNQQIKREKLNHLVDKIHHQYGFTKLFYADSLRHGGTAIDRANLIGGHNGGNSYE